MKNYTAQKNEILEVGRLLFEKRFVASNDGNLSIRVNDSIIITPTSVSKGFLSVDNLVVVDLKGKIISGKSKPTSEILMHLEIYKRRPDIFAVCHAHPPYSTGFASAGIPLTKKILPEVIIALDSIPLVKYATPGTPELSKKMLPFIKKYDAILLQNHGVITMGSSLQNAYFKMETVEHFAWIYFISTLIGKPKELKRNEIKKLVLQREKFGIRKNVGRK